MKKVMAHMTMAEALNRLPAEHFARIHRSYIVAIDRIDTFEKNKARGFKQI